MKHEMLIYISPIIALVVFVVGALILSVYLKKEYEAKSQREMDKLENETRLEMEKLEAESLFAGTPENPVLASDVGHVAAMVSLFDHGYMNLSPLILNSHQEELRWMEHDILAEARKRNLDVLYYDDLSGNRLVWHPSDPGREGLLQRISPS